MSKKIFLVITLIIAFQLIVLVHAEEGVTLNDASHSLNVEGVTFLEKIINLLNKNKFIITQTGIDRGCDYIRTGNQMSVPVGSGASVSASSVCTSGHGEIIIYSKLVGDNNLYPKLEFRDSGSFNCADASGKEKCVVEFYCCPYGECSSNNDCISQEGTGSQCTTKNYVYYDAFSQTPKYYSNEVLSTSYKMCTAGSGCIPKTCSQLGKNCGSWDNGCGQTIGCGSCSESQTCSGGLCTSACTPSCSGKSCGASDGCSGICNEACSGGGDGGSGGGSGTVIDEPTIDATIFNEIVMDSNGKALTENSIVQPGDTLIVKFKVKTTRRSFEQHIQDLISFQKPREEFLVETGVIPVQTAFDWNIRQNSGTFSIYDTFSITNIKTECCTSQPNVKAFNTKFAELLAGVTADTEITLDYELKVVVPDSATKDLCPVNDGRAPSVYWDANNPQYLVYITVKNDCYAKEGVLTGFTNGIYKAIPIKVNVNNTNVISGGGALGDKCTYSGDCKSGICVSSSLWYDFGVVKRCAASDFSNTGSGENGTYSLIDVKKISLTRDEISKATTTELVGSACYTSKECILTEEQDEDKYSPECISLKKLNEDEVISADSIPEFWNTANSIGYGSAMGAGVGLAVCTVGSTLAGALTGGSTLVLLPLCSAAGALIGASATGAIIENSADDKLVKAMQERDTDRVGICTAEEGFDYCKYTEWAGFISITKNKCNDGLIFIIGSLIIISFLFSGGKK